MKVTVLYIFFILMALCAPPLCAQPVEPIWGGANTLYSGTTPIVGGATTQVCFNDAGFVACGDAGLTWTKATDTLSIGNTGTIQQIAVDGTVDGNAIRFGNLTFTGVQDPTIVVGYRSPGGGGPNFEWELEGNYNDVSGGHVWSEFYITRKDTGIASYRPFGVGTYDGHAEAGFNVDQFTVVNRAGTKTGFASYPDSDYSLLGSTNVLNILGNNRYALKQEQSTPANYIGLIGLNSSNQIMIGEGNVAVNIGGLLHVGNLVSITSPVDGQLQIERTADTTQGSSIVIGTKNLSNNSATTFAIPIMAAGTQIGGTIHFAIEDIDATNRGVIAGMVRFAAIDIGGTITCSINATDASAVTVGGSGGFANTFSCADGGTNYLMLNATALTTGGTDLLRLRYTIIADSVVTIAPQ